MVDEQSHPNSPQQVGNFELIAELNHSLVLQSVRAMQPTYRAAIARRTGLNPATVTNIVSHLLALGVLEEVVDATQAPMTKGGRPPQMLRVNAKPKQVLAIDLEPDCLRVALTDLLAEPLVHRECLIDRRSDSRTICRQMIKLCREILKEHAPVHLLGVGVSLPGLIDVNKGVALSSTNMPGWRNVPIARMLQRELGVPVHLGRSMHLAALHERWVRPQLEQERVVLLSLRTGIGMSLMERGQILGGPGSPAGEIGHTVIDLNGVHCECGNRGCLETFVSATAVVARGRRMLEAGRGQVLRELLDQHEPLRPELIYRLAHAGDADCMAIVRDVGRYIGLAAANVINLLAPDHLVLCGSIDTADELILDALRKEVQQRALPRLSGRVQLRLAAAREKGPLLGAAVMVAQQVFDLPDLRRVSHRVPVSKSAATPRNTLVNSDMGLS